MGEVYVVGARLITLRLLLPANFHQHISLMFSSLDSGGLDPSSKICQSVSCLLSVCQYGPSRAGQGDVADFIQ